MFENDDIRFAPKESRPPWEYSSTGDIREFFAPHSRVDEVGGPRRCDEVEKLKQERTALRREKAKDFREARMRREARQRAMDQNAAAVPPRPAGKSGGEYEDLGDLLEELEAGRSDRGEDPRGRRYDYSGASLRTRKPRRGLVAGIALLIAVSLVVTSVIQVMSAVLEEGAVEPAPEPEEWLPDGDEDFGQYFGDDFGQDWDEFEEFFGGTYEEEEYPTASDEELPRADLVEDMEFPVVSSAGKTPLTFQELYKKCAPSTVSITVYARDGMSSGTGIVMTEDGYILTCEHVIADSSSCTVVTWDDQVFEATLVGADAQTDLAVLKVEAQGLIPAEFGDSDELTVGDEAIAIGDPLGSELRGTMTNGIISAINRNVVVQGYTMTLLQTTAALNSGNSGGPLINIYGQVVGVNNMKMNSTDVTVEGLGFAVPTSVVRQIVPQLAAVGEMHRPMLGVTCYSLDAAAAEAEGYPGPGLLIASVNQDADCYDKGLRVGDMVYAIEGRPVSDVSQVKEIIEGMVPGDTVTLAYYHFPDESDLTEYEELEIRVELADQSDIS